MKPLITALVDTYNHEEYIEQALASVLEQGLSAAELEIVVVDDGSTDRTPSIVQKFVPRVRHLRKKNGGQASAFNAAVPEIDGQIVAMLDGDDWWARGKLAAVLGAFERNPELSAVSHGYYDFHEETKEEKVCTLPEDTFLSLGTPEAPRQAFAAWRFLVTSALTVRKTVLERALPIPEVLVFSADAPIAMASVAAGVLVLAQPYSYYRHHSGNLYATAAEDRAQLRRKCEIDEAMFDVLDALVIRLGVSSECVSSLLDSGWADARRFRLRTFGGSRLETFRTEMRAFHSDFKNPGIGYLLFKYLGVGAATFLLPPRLFYEARDWYAQRNLGRLRDRLFNNGSTLGGEPVEGEKALPSRSK